ncbi:hypothetical protein RXV86_08265 [Alisedimentitalea sp. MJ-SS2]|uniref:hypothetical protein n=1 Tax=Aliisedimentitalea sp. MJ-SS2 TaxID=3049795 RepID=UPI002913091D|nr:hypothetical protein [Alisedimentitalea sp. MJ-SS2]MDU8927374.1 hypothetical protein [Alisedimentitalea sp. MJ-SS2]
MNRRQFNTRLTALGLAPLVPSVASSSAVGPLSPAASAQYPWALQYTRVHGSCSPARLAKALKVKPEIAGQLFARLQANGIVSAPGFTGIARTVNPIDWNLQSAASPMQKAGRTLQRLHDAFRKTSAPEPDEQPLKEARKTESAHSPVAQSTGSAEHRPA